MPSLLISQVLLLPSSLYVLEELRPFAGTLQCLDQLPHLAFEMQKKRNILTMVINFVLSSRLFKSFSNIEIDKSGVSILLLLCFIQMEFPLIA